MPDDIQDRIILRMLNECVACLREGVITTADMAVAGSIFAISFVPFRGGPLHYAENRGISNIINRLNELKDKYGDRFEPDAGWDALKK